MARRCSRQWRKPALGQRRAIIMDIAGTILAEHANEFHRSHGRHMELTRHRLANIVFGEKALKERHRLIARVATS